MLTHQHHMIHSDVSESANDAVSGDVDDASGSRTGLHVEEPMIVETADGQRLEALGRFPSSAQQAIVLCHPHPLHGGTMQSTVIAELCRAFEQYGEQVATLRFNYRGVQGSTGTYENGDGEALDVVSAVDGIRRYLPHARLQIVGYSFGSWVGMRAAWHHPDVQRMCLIAPATRILRYRESAQECRRALACKVIVGDEDTFTSVSDARKLACYLGSSLEVIEGADHFFTGYLPQVISSVVSFVVA